jgi:hypothetical protein
MQREYTDKLKSMFENVLEEREEKEIVILEYEDINKGEIITYIGYVMRKIEDDYNQLWKPLGNYVVFEHDVSTWEKGYQFVLRYQMSETEQEQIISNGGSINANTYVMTLYLNSETGEVTNDMGYESWNLGSIPEEIINHEKELQRLDKFLSEEQWIPFYCTDLTGNMVDIENVIGEDYIASNNLYFYSKDDITFPGKFAFLLSGYTVGMDGMYWGDYELDRKYIYLKEEIVGKTIQIERCEMKWGGETFPVLRLIDEIQTTSGAVENCILYFAKEKNLKKIAQ